jgi:hypothetical protein
MRLAPPVAVDCDGGGAWRWIQALLSAFASAHLAAWGAARAEWPLEWQVAVAGLAAIAAGALVLRALPRAPVRLAWDGESWTLGAHDNRGEIEVMIDLGPWLLLRFRSEVAVAASPRWLSVGGEPARGQFHALRTAVYCAPFQPTDRARSPERQPD